MAGCCLRWRRRHLAAMRSPCGRGGKGHMQTLAAPPAPSHTNCSGSRSGASAGRRAPEMAFRGPHVLLSALLCGLVAAGQPPSLLGRDEGASSWQACRREAAGAAGEATHAAFGAPKQPRVPQMTRQLACIGGRAPEPLGFGRYFLPPSALCGRRRHCAATPASSCTRLQVGCRCSCS